MLSKRRRSRHGSSKTLNQIGAKMASYVKKKDREDDKLLTNALFKDMRKCKATLQVLKDTAAKLAVMSSRMAKTKRFIMWRGAYYGFKREIKTILDLESVPWTHSDEVVRRLKYALAQMSKYQTSTAMHWLQLEIMEMLRDAMERLFWT